VFLLDLIVITSTMVKLLRLFVKNVLIPVFNNIRMVEMTDLLFRSLCNQLTFAAGVVKITSQELVYLNKQGELDLLCAAPLSTDVLLTDKLMFNEPTRQEVYTALQKQQPFRKTIFLPGSNSKCAEVLFEPVEGNETYAFFIITDISASVKTEEKLLKEIQKFEALINYASMGVLVVNETGTIVLANPFVNRLFEYTASEMLDKKIEDLIPSRFRHSHEQHRNRFNQQPEGRSMGLGLELFGVKKSGVEFPVQISLGHYQNEEGRFGIAFIVDDSLRKANEIEIIRQKEAMASVNSKMKQLNELLEVKVAERTQMLQDTLRELEQSRDNLTHALEKEKQLNDMKSRFVSMASHEFRTPLSTILSSVTLLSKYVSAEDQLKREKHIDRIKGSVTTLTDILEEFLSLGKIEDGKVEPKWTEFSLPDLLSSVARQMEPLLKAGQVLKQEHFGNERIVLDPGLLKNILINLISNAIKFSPEQSSITVTTHFDKSDVEISIKDQGLGISKEDQQHLFERFFRGANVTNIQGTGLGLHIVSRYIQLMNGAIVCKSELEKGTEFIIRFKQHRFEY
jgi:PAS domain S-box-containing protein